MSNVDEAGVAIRKKSQLKKCDELTSINSAKTAGEYNDLLLLLFSILFIPYILYSLFTMLM